jgi:hypothetical protein
MKRYTLLFACILSGFILTAQKNKHKDSNIPAFGVVEKAELEMKECEFDDKAEAMVLFDKGELAEITGSGIDLVRHVRIKILNDKGKDRADIHLRYYSYKNDEDIKDISAQTYNLDANGNIVVTKVDKKQIFEKQINKRYAEKVFTFPEVRPGSIIEYKFKHTNIGMIQWYFQRSIPVKYSEFTFDYSSDREVAFTPRCYLPYEQKSETKGTRTTRFFAMHNVPALRDEPYILNEDDYLQKIESKTVALNFNGRWERITLTWPRVIKLLMEDEDFGLQLKKEIPRTADLDAQLRNINNPYLRMKAIHEYVKKNMQWDGSPGIWALNGVKAAWKDKKGTAGEINLILVNLLKDAGLDAKPILVSTHDNGLVNTSDPGTLFRPGTNQFNKVLAWVTISNDFYVLDATDQETPGYLIPPDVITTEGLVIEKIDSYEWGWQTLWKDKHLYRNTVYVLGNITEEGKLEGQAFLNSYDYARLSRITTARKGEKDFTEKYFTSSNPGITIDSVRLENLDADSMPLVQKVYFNQQLNSSGDYRYFSVNLFTGLEKNPFVADERISDVFFGLMQAYSIIGSFQIPDDFEFDELPKNIKMMMPDTSIIITRISQVDGERLTLRISLEFKKTYYSPDEYGPFQEFYKKLYDLLNEQFVIRKKAKS